MSTLICSTLSVVVIGRNEGERLRGCLASVNAMQRGVWSVEIIYVDSGSTDRSIHIAEQSGARVIALKPERPTAALGRNAGWLAASGQIILFLDGDTLLHPDFVYNSLTEFANPNISIVWGHRRELQPERSIYNRVLDLDWIYAPGLTPFCGGDALVRHSILLKTGGFDETLIAGEEPELCRRVLALGGLILHVDRPMTSHDLAIESFSPYWKRASRAGHAFAEVSVRFATTSQPFWSAEVRRNRNRAVTLMVVPPAAGFMSIVLHSPWPLAVAIVLFAFLVTRTAWKARWKSYNRVTLLLYGVHSHLQQIPIFWGQMGFRLNRRRGQQAALVEYKNP